MPNKPLVSVVVPVFNAEDFLAECVNSILSQTYKNIEIILINDGSTDRSSIICDNYADLDARVSVIHQSNRGVSAARNAGINSAVGKYITFIDSDDTIHPDYVYYLTADMMDNISDITTTPAGGAKSRWHRYVASRADGAEVVVLSIEDSLRELYRGTLEGTRNGVQMMNLNMLNRNKIRYNENMKVGEDFDFFARAVLVSNKVVVDRKRLYFYRTNPSSAMQQNFSLKHFDAINNVANIGRSVEAKIPGLKKAIDSMVFSDAIFYGAKMINVKNKWPKEYREIVRYIKRYRRAVLTDDEARNNTRIKALIVIIFGIDVGLAIIKRLIKW